MSASTLWLLSIFSILSIAACINDKCAACNGVVAELEIQLTKEKPRNHLDMSHQLDSKGQRQGKVIDYRMSELRAVELLDGLCDNMQDYTLEKIDSSRREWIKVDNWGILNIGFLHFFLTILLAIVFYTFMLLEMQISKKVGHTRKKYPLIVDGETAWMELLEETDGELTELIKKGSVKQGDVSKLLCEDLSKHCSGSSDSDNDSDSDSNDEL